MTGFGWIAFGADDSVTDPTCGSPSGPISANLPCQETLWSNPTALCVSGYLPPVIDGEYDANWGISIGVNATPLAGGVLGQSFAGVAVSVGGSPQTGLRIVAHRNGDLDSTTYCALMTPGVAVPFTSFNTACWDGSGTALSLADVTNLDNVGVQIPSGSTAVTITNLCVQGITFVR